MSWCGYVQRNDLEECLGNHEDDQQNEQDIDHRRDVDLACGRARQPDLHLGPRRVV